jgi:hypothetical protein
MVLLSTGKTAMKVISPGLCFTRIDFFHTPA